MRQRGQQMVKLYKDIAKEHSEKIHPKLIYPMKMDNEMLLDIDCLMNS